jgi:PIN domain nuclease of toxin-antitoxin system
VLDASALLGLLNAEQGSDLVQDRLPQSIISAVNLAEVVTRLSILGMPEKAIRETMDLLALEIFAFDEKQAFEAGFLSIYTRPLGLSFGDRACLALARSIQAVAVTADRAWKELEIGVEIELIR